jgi:hypothetical protein
MERIIEALLMSANLCCHVRDTSGDFHTTQYARATLERLNAASDAIKEMGDGDTDRP